MKSDRLLVAWLAVAWAAGAAPLAIVSPAPKAVVPTMTEGHKAYLALPRAERIAAFADPAYRDWLYKLGTEPKPVKIAWQGGTPPYEVTLRRECDSRDVFSAVTEKTEVFVDNLEIARRYVCTVGDGRNRVHTDFTTEDVAPRLLRVPGVHNARDFGGWKTLSGCRVKQGRVLRTGGFNANADTVKLLPGKSWVTEATRDVLLGQFGVKTDIDLRAYSECVLMGGSPLGPDVEWYHLGVFAYDKMDSLDGRAVFKTIFRIFLDETKYPIDFHCIYGKDRTGSVAFVLGALLGMAEEDLYRDWEASGFWVNERDFIHGTRFNRLLHAFDGYKGETIHARVEEYVKSLGYTAADIAHFRSLMLEPADYRAAQAAAGAVRPQLPSPVHDLIGTRWPWGAGTVRIDGEPAVWPRKEGPLAVEVTRTPDGVGFGFAERYVFRNVSQRPITLSDIDVNTPFNDNYLGMSEDHGAKRCHAHVWPGGSGAWVNAMRMNGAAPHLGLVVTEGAVMGYELKGRSFGDGSSDSRGLICLSPPDVTLAPGEAYTLAWRVFEHQGHDDFARKLVEFGGVKVTADRWTVTKAHPANVTFEWKGGRETRSVTYEREGEIRVPFKYGDGKETFAELNAIADPLEHVLRRARFIVAHQQFLKEGDPYDGAFVQYDTEARKPHLNWIDHGTADWAPGAERFGIPVSLALLLQRGYTEFLAPLKRFARYAETLYRADGYVYCDLSSFSRKRDFNSPWAAEFFLEFGKATGERRHYKLGYRILRDLYGRIGPHRLVESRERESVEILRAAGMSAEADELVKLFAAHKDNLLRKKGGVSREVNFAPEGAAGIVSQFLDCYALTGRAAYRDYVLEYRPWFEANLGRQPTWHAHDIGLHHWDGYWFGKRRCWGDTLPHHWNGTAIDAFKALAKVYGDAAASARAEPIAEQLLGLVRPDGTAGCAFVYPNRVNGEWARFLDPLANDQDWALSYYLRHEK